MLEVDYSNVTEQIHDGAYTTSRSLWKSLKGLSHEEFDQFLLNLGMEFYKNGVRDTENIFHELGSESMTVERVIEIARTIRGIGPMRGGELETKLKEEYLV